ncbi:hypothetical protein B8W66_22115 [Mycobacterium decipiens]|uniref:Uncharacterized protein n=1 Tax=Mycobacterium decipiens TaxID=1430326 RepID=A0A1X2LPC0_9MYCO|nr:hypothetical protein B8W66_22115 [Mycobacterium decipiens]
MVGAFIAVPGFAVTVRANADPINPFNPSDCMANADAVCNLGPYGPNSPINPASPMDPMNPLNPMNPMNPANPMIP